MVNIAGDSQAGGKAADSKKNEFRKDIEGLRAVAILAVIGAHANIPLLQGGFIGVDIFFVLSGYLISGLLIREINVTGRINFIAFYARRFKRLLPGLMLMLLTASLAGAIVFSPAEQIAQAGTAQSAFLWLSNFYFIFANFGYFDLGADSNLFLHTWSLGVEEQFYLVWPWLVLFFMTGMTTGAGADREKTLTSGFVLIFALCLFICIALSSLSPLWGFYSMPARGWQFALGALVFLHVEKISKEKIPHSVAGNEQYSAKTYALAGWCGLLLILGSVVAINQSMIYPGGWALAPSTGAALLLFSGSGKASPFVSRMLAAKPMRALGRVSYSWYLWHWPVLVIGNVLLQREELSYQLLLAGISLGIAVLAYYVVEQPARNSSWLNLRPLLTASCSVVLMISGASLASSWNNKAQTWSTIPSQIIYQQIRSDMPAPYSMGCDEWFSSAQVKACSFGDPAAEKTAVLFGDSVGAQWFSALARNFVESGWRFIVLTKSACPLVDQPIFYARIGSEYTVCEIWRNASIKFLGELKPDLIFMGSAANYEYSAAEWLAGTDRVLAQLSGAAEKIYIIRGTPRLPFDGPGCLARHDWQPKFLAELSECQAQESLEPDIQVLAALQAAAGGYANVRILDLNPLVCPDGLCTVYDGSNIVFRDSQHIANRFVESVSEHVRREIENAN